MSWDRFTFLNEKLFKIEKRQMNELEYNHINETPEDKLITEWFGQIKNY